MTDTPTAGRFDGATHVLPMRVYYEDTDFTGVVYHANYLRYLERGRTDCLRLAGVEHQALWEGEEGIAFAIRKLAIEYLKPARVDDALVVHTATARATGVRLVLRQWITRAADTLIKAEVEAVAIGRDGRAKRPSDTLRERLLALLPLPPDSPEV